MLSVEGSLASRDAVGGAAPVRVAEQLDAARAALAALREWTMRGRLSLARSGGCGQTAAHAPDDAGDAGAGSRT